MRLRYPALFGGVSPFGASWESREGLFGVPRRPKRGNSRAPTNMCRRLWNVSRCRVNLEKAKASSGGDRTFSARFTRFRSGKPRLAPWLRGPSRPTPTCPTASAGPDHRPRNAPSRRAGWQLAQRDGSSTIRVRHADGDDTNSPRRSGSRGRPGSASRARGRRRGRSAPCGRRRGRRCPRCTCRSRGSGRGCLRSDPHTCRWPRGVRPRRTRCVQRSAQGITSR
jgi:hypothetical protein